MTKFRTVRGWLVGCGIAAVLMVAFAVLAAAGTDARVGGPGGPRGGPPVGPDGTAVLDGFTLVAQPLAGDGTLTVRVASLTGTALRPLSAWRHRAAGAGEPRPGCSRAVGQGRPDGQVQHHARFRRTRRSW